MYVREKISRIEYCCKIDISGRICRFGPSQPRGMWGVRHFTALWIIGKEAFSAAYEFWFRYAEFKLLKMKFGDGHWQMEIHTWSSE